MRSNFTLLAVVGMLSLPGAAFAQTSVAKSEPLYSQRIACGETVSHIVLGLTGSSTNYNDPQIRVWRLKPDARDAVAVPDKNHVWCGDILTLPQRMIKNVRVEVTGQTIEQFGATMAASGAKAAITIRRLNPLLRGRVLARDSVYVPRELITGKASVISEARPDSTSSAAKQIAGIARDSGIGSAADSLPIGAKLVQRDAYGRNLDSLRQALNISWESQQRAERRQNLMTWVIGIVLALVLTTIFAVTFGPQISARFQSQGQRANRSPFTIPVSKLGAEAPYPPGGPAWVSQPVPPPAEPGLQLVRDDHPEPAAGVRSA